MTVSLLTPNVANAASTATADSANKSFLELRKVTCPSGMAGYRCVWTDPAVGDICPDKSRWPIGVWKCAGRF